MNQRKFITFLLSFWCMISFAQQQEVISSLGKLYTDNSGSISFTLGEIIYNTFISPDIILSQGFQQSKLVILDTQPAKVQDNDITVYPNPAREFVILEVEIFQDFSYILFDITGRVIDENDIYHSHSEINFSNLDPSIYILKVFRKREEFRTFKITKY